jgi:hypothetical protein
MRSPEGERQGQPGAGYALLGAAFGLLLIFLGSLIPFRVVSWPIVGVGLVFVVVMTAYAVVVLWHQTAGHVRRFSGTARGRVIHDPLLGTLTRDLTARCWVGTITRGSQTLDVAIAGDEQPDAPRLAHVRDLLSDFQTLERQVESFLATEAADEALQDPELAAEIRTLRIASLNLRSTERPDLVVVDFEGPNEMRYWCCEYVDGQLRGLRFDS